MRQQATCRTQYLCRAGALKHATRTRIPLRNLPAGRFSILQITARLAPRLRAESAGWRKRKTCSRRVLRPAHRFLIVTSVTPDAADMFFCYFGSLLLMHARHRAAANSRRVLACHHPALLGPVQYLRHDPQLRIGPSMPIILQMCAPKHATFV